MRNPANRTLRAALLLSALGVTLVGCSAERAIVAPIEPDWSYHDGQTQLSNNDAWEQMVPSSALLRLDESKLASVEESTAE